MSRESGELIRRRNRAEIERLSALCQSSGMRQSDFCRRHEMALSTLSCYLLRQKKSHSGSDYSRAAVPCCPLTTLPALEKVRQLANSS
jgi:hypothetical protein